MNHRPGDPAGRTPKDQQTRSSGHPLRLTAALAGLLVVILIVGALLLTGGIGTRRIADGVSAAGLPLGGMTRGTAYSALRKAFDPADHDLTLTVNTETLCLSQAQTGAALDLRTLLDDALAVAAEDVVNLSLAPYLSMDEERLYRTLEQEAQCLDRGYSLPSYTLEGDIPPLSEDKWDPDGAMPTLAVTLGTPGYTMDASAAVELIFAGLAEGEFDIDLSDALVVQEPPAPDAAEILQTVSIAPVDARMDQTAKTPIPGAYGLSYDAEALAALLSDAAAGQTVRVTLEPVAPEVTELETCFQDVLGFCQTPHGNNEKRNTNLALACQALNGVVLQPGQTLSYNETLGRRTKEAGYQEAPAYSGTDLVDSLGGGICQVSSTLYLSALYAELEIVDRVSHGYPATYMPVGLDATVSWGAPDLKIKNNGEYPIKLIAEVRDGFVRVWIMGIETRDYYVRMAYSSSTDGYARSYYCRYDNQTHELLTKTEAALSGYLSISTPVVGEIGSEEAYVNGNVREQPPCSPSEETLEAARNYQEPNTRG